MESDSARTAQEQLHSLAATREAAIERILLPRRYVIGWAVFSNAYLFPVVLPIVLSEDWTLRIQAAFLAAGAALLIAQLRRPRVKRPRLRVQGAWILTVAVAVGLGSTFATAIYAGSQDNPWLGAAALLMNFATYLVFYGGLGFLLRRQLARLP